MPTWAGTDSRKKYADGEKVLDKVLKTDINNVAAIWYGGIGNFYNALERQAIDGFEKALTMLDKKADNIILQIGSWVNVTQIF